VAASVARDEALSEQLSALARFIQPLHLDIPTRYCDDAVFQAAQIGRYCTALHCTALCHRSLQWVGLDLA
jgi:hypothetical protein